MRKRKFVYTLALGAALLPASGAFSQAPNPTPNRESKLIAGFETETRVTSDPNEAGENRASINTDVKFVAEGSRSLKVDLNDLGEWRDNYFVVDFAEPIDISGHLMLSVDVYIPAASLNPDSSENGWFQLYPHVTTTRRDNASETTETWLGMRNLKVEEGWNHLVWDLATGTDTKITRVAFAGTTNESRPWSGPIYVDNIRVYKGSFHGIQPDEKLIAGFDDPNDKARFTGDEGVKIDVNTDKAFIRDGAGSLKIDLTGQTAGFSSGFVRADDLGAAIDVANATAIHLDLFIPEASQPTGDWKELGFTVLGAGGEVQGATAGFLTNQWITLQIVLTPEQARTLSTVKGLFLTRNNDPNTPWNGPIYMDNLRVVVPTR